MTECSCDTWVIAASWCRYACANCHCYATSGETRTVDVPFATLKSRIVIFEQVVSPYFSNRLQQQPFVSWGNRRMPSLMLKKWRERVFTMPSRKTRHVKFEGDHRDVINRIFVSTGLSCFKALSMDNDIDLVVFNHEPTRQHQTCRI